MDTFPIERLRLMDGKVAQKYVTLDENNKWVELWGDPTPDVKKLLASMENDLGYTFPLREDAEEPLNPDALKLQKMLDKSLERGAIINIDYGRNGEVGTRDEPAIRHYEGRARLREMEDLYLHLPIEERQLLTGYFKPGEVDITTDVNFALLIAQARKDDLTVAHAGTQRELLLRAGTRDLAEQYHQALGSATTWPEYWSLLREMNGFSDIINVKQSSISPLEFGKFYSTVLTKGIDSKALQFKQITDKGTIPLDTPYISIEVGRPNTPITIELLEETYVRRTDHDGIFRERLEEFSIKPGMFSEAEITYQNYDGKDVVLKLADDEELQKRCSQLNSQLEKNSLSIHEYSSQVADIIYSHSRQLRQKGKRNEEEAT